MTNLHAEADRTILDNMATGGLGELEIVHPPTTVSPTPASRIALRAIGLNRALLRGYGLDWGCGTGCLAIAAAKIPEVKAVIGLDIFPPNVVVAGQNGLLNGVGDKVTFWVADSYIPVAEADRQRLAAWRGQVDFVLSNPPASNGDDGFGYRRVVLAGARDYLVRGGVVFLNISSQYGRPRIDRLSQQFPQFRHEGILASSDWVPFDLQRPDLWACLLDYVGEEARGGLPYCFGVPAGITQTAQTALTHFQRSGVSPLTQWQTHLFRFV